MADVNTFDWRRRKAGSHTSEVISQALKIAALEKDVADLKALVAGMGKVTLNDLIRRSA